MDDAGAVRRDANHGVGSIAPHQNDQAYRLRIDGRQWSMVLRDTPAGNDLNFHLKKAVRTLPKSC